MCRDKFGPLADAGARVAQAESLQFLCCVFLVLLLTSPYLLPVRNTGPVCLSVTETESLLIPYPQTPLHQEITALYHRDSRAPHALIMVMVYLV